MMAVKIIAKGMVYEKWGVGVVIMKEMWAAYWVNEE